MPSSDARIWDRRFCRLLAIAAVAAVVGLAFGGPFDNLVVIGWLLPVWIFARLFVPARISTHAGAQ